MNRQALRPVRLALAAALGVSLAPLAAAAQSPTCSIQGNMGSCTTAPAVATNTIIVPRVVQLAVSAVPPEQLVTATDVSAGSRGFAGPTVTVQANSAWELRVNTTQDFWSAAAIAGSTPRTDKPVGDLRWSSTGGPVSLVNAPPGVPGIVATGAPTNVTTIGLSYQMLLQWLLDRPGDYTVPVVFTLAAP